MGQLLAHSISQVGTNVVFSSKTDNKNYKKPRKKIVAFGHALLFLLQR